MISGNKNSKGTLKIKTAINYTIKIEAASRIENIKKNMVITIIRREQA